MDGRQWQRSAQTRLTDFTLCPIRIIYLACLMSTSIAGQTIGNSIEGVITDLFGAPLCDVTVTISLDDQKVTVPAMTDKQGRYQFTRLPTGVALLSFRLSGFRREEIAVALYTNDRLRLRTGLEVGQLTDVPKARIEGFVRDQEGRVLGGVTVKITNDFNNRISAETKTDRNGHYRIALAPRGQYTLCAVRGPSTGGPVTLIAPALLQDQRREVDILLPTVPR